MTSSDIIRTLLYGLWIPVAFISFLYLFWNYYKSIQARRYERYKVEYTKETDYRLIEELRYRLERQLDEMRSFIPQIIESTLEQNLSKQSRETAFQLQELNNYIQNFNKPGLLDQKIESKNDNAQLIREISHSLNTPLSQIEAGLLNLDFDSSKLAELNKDYPEIISSIKTSIELCKAIIASYRELILVAKSSTMWNPKSLTEIINKSFSIYEKKIGKTFKLKNNLPNNILGYSNNYVTSLLLPLIENAMEASIPDSEIGVNYTFDTQKLSIGVTNISENIPDENIYKESFTTKENHSGTGLSIVQHLLTAYKDAEINHTVKGNYVTFTITLPNSN